MRAAAEFLPELVRDAANVSALGAGNPELAERRFIIRETEIINVNQPRFALHFDAFARQLVERHAVLFDG